MGSVNLTPLSRILIVVALLVGSYFLLRNFIPGLQGTDTTTTTEIDGSNAPTEESTTDNNSYNNETSSTETTEQKTPTSTTATFSYVPPSPVKGALKGVVELGASGFNSFIVNMDSQKNWKLEKAEWGNSLVYDGMASAEDIRSGLKKFIGGMLDFGVVGRDIHFVVSSGALKVDATNKIIKELKGMGYVVNTVTPEQEGRYALQASLPKSFYNNSFMVDIGSGNTKISWMDGNIKAYETFGAKYYVDKVPDTKVYQEVRASAAQIPDAKRKTCFMLGGIPFELAKQVRKDNERYTVLKAPKDYKVEGAKMQAGLNIYNALVDGTGCDTFVFDWEGNFTIGFLLNL